MYHSDRETDHNIGGACFNSDWDQLGDSNDSWLDAAIENDRRNRIYQKHVDWIYQNSHIKTYYDWGLQTVEEEIPF